MATNSHSVKYEMLRFGHGLLVFFLNNFINKVHASIDTELCMRLNFFDLCWFGEFGIGSTNYPQIDFLFSHHLSG